ncbi:SGNH/GDSL hydrolase family protein [Mycolicibacterium komossense]|uniref:SGNH/GDSL hydrolase family protein n=1 Tax=Mycolicibacterium komossense TaxID=1779 RepID=A0ABT3CI83_9MYCO|nr:SGNH/GDSL hydrolase family protein [Mycolicibacterium komossense]MCV7229160.1 SGNH/GDSL hydrolase family protein [Mycolicibacterium komossense]
MAFSRYVAIGDSQTEGLWDGADSTLVGFADRLAIRLDELYPGLLYANLAVRGRRVGDVLNHQLPQALSMEADLITVCVGMNDATLPGRSFERALLQLDVLHERLAASGAAVVTTTFPNVAKTLPVGRLLAARIIRINTAIRSAATQYGFHLVDLYTAPSMIERDTWSTDRMHASTKGHILFAAAAAEALGLPGSSHDWAQAAGAGAAPGPGARAFAQLQWTRNMLAPWIWRHLRGRSAGDGRAPKRPVLHGVR